MTRDLDLVVQLETGDVDRFVQLFADDFYDCGGGVVGQDQIDVGNRIWERHGTLGSIRRARRCQSDSHLGFLFD